MDIVLNEQSGRKSLCALAFPDGGGEQIRAFSEAAMAKPHKAIAYMRELLGRTHRKDSTYGPHYFPHSIHLDETRGACRVVASPGETLAPETLNAMLLTWAKNRVKEHTGFALTRCVITVPPFFTQSQRRALLAAASIAGVSLLTSHVPTWRASVDHTAALPPLEF